MTGDTPSSTRWPLALGIVAMAIASVAALCATRYIIASRYAADEVIIIEKLHQRMLDDRRYFAQSRAPSNGSSR